MPTTANTMKDKRDQLALDFIRAEESLRGLPFITPDIAEMAANLIFGAKKTCEPDGSVALSTPTGSDTTLHATALHRALMVIGIEVDEQTNIRFAHSDPLKDVVANAIEVKFSLAANLSPPPEPDHVQIRISKENINGAYTNRPSNRPSNSPEDISKSVSECAAYLYWISEPLLLSPQFQQNNLSLLAPENLIFTENKGIYIPKQDSSSDQIGILMATLSRAQIPFESKISQGSGHVIAVPTSFLTDLSQLINTLNNSQKNRYTHLIPTGSG